MPLAHTRFPVALDEQRRRPPLTADSWLTLLLLTVLLGPITSVVIEGHRMTVFWSDVTLIALVMGLCLKRRISAPKAAWWYLLYLAVTLVSLRMSAEPLRSFAILLKLQVAPLLVFLFVYNYVICDRVVSKVVVHLVWFGAALSVLTMVNWVRIQNGAVGPFYHPDRIIVLTAKDAAQTSFGRSNYLASMLIVLIPLALYKTKRAKAAWGALLAMIVALIATQSRGGLISLSFAFIVWLVLSLRYLQSSAKSLAGLMVRVAICLGVMTVVWRFLPDAIMSDFASRMVDLRASFDSGDYEGNRRGTWAPASQHVMSAPIAGIGFGNEEADPTALDMNSGSAHNLYLQVLLATGALGLIPLALFLWSCGAAWFGLLRFSLVKEDRALAAAALFLFAASLINSFEEPSFWGLEYSRVLWILFGLGFVIRRLRLNSGQYRTTEAAPTVLTRVGTIRDVSSGRAPVPVLARTHNS